MKVVFVLLVLLVAVAIAESSIDGVAPERLAVEWIPWESAVQIVASQKMQSNLMMVSDVMMLRKTSGD
jgi:hypothetical protein